jgi:hypothetical protein
MNVRYNNHTNGSEGRCEHSLPSGPEEFESEHDGGPATCCARAFRRSGE